MGEVMYKYRKHFRGSFLNYCAAIIVILSIVFSTILGALLFAGR